MEKIKIDKDEIQKFIDSKEEDCLNLFFEIIDGMDYSVNLGYAELDDEQGILYKSYFLDKSAVGCAFLSMEDRELRGDEINYYMYMDADAEKITEMCQRQTDIFVEAINKQFEIIENEDDVEEIVGELVNTYGSVGLLLDDENILYNYLQKKTVSKN